VSRVMNVAVASLAVVLTGCGTAAGPATGADVRTSYGTIGPPVHRSPSERPTPSAPASPLGNVLTAADDGATVTVMTGQWLTVDLAPGAGAYAWDRPRLIGSALRLVSADGGYPSPGPMQAVFLATTPGTAVVSSGSDMPCLHAHPRCLVAQRLWTVHVVVRSTQ
jgi:hypothetical protein